MLGEGDDDGGDGQSNELVESCPFFRNEIGGEEERIVSLSRLQNGTKNHRKPLHRPQLAYGVAILEFPPDRGSWNTEEFRDVSRQLFRFEQFHDGNTVKLIGGIPHVLIKGSRGPSKMLIKELCIIENTFQDKFAKIDDRALV
ncbi:hypothetical protein YQE_01375, partial [Dendroctonus ponderosae]